MDELEQYYENILPQVEKAIDLKLYDWQKEYIKGNERLKGGRGAGKTLAYCLRLALWLCDTPIDLSSDLYNDGAVGSMKYHCWFKNEFMNIWNKLNDAEIPVRAVIT